MIVIVTGTIAASRRLMAQARDSLATLDRPAAYLDGHEGWRFDPVSARHVPADAALERVVTLAESLWANGARALVVSLPDEVVAQGATALPQAAFFLRRTAAQPVYGLDIDEAIRQRQSGTWSSDMMDSTLRACVKALGPPNTIKPWEPTPPRHETERLVLTWPTPGQVEAYCRAIIGTDIFDTLIWNGPSCEGDLHDYWLKCRQDYARAGGRDRQLSLAVIEKSSNAMIGACSLRPQLVAHGIWDIGYAYAKAWHGKGYATEAGRALLDIAFKERKAERVMANAFVGNDASRRVLQKLGFTLEGTSRSTIAKPMGRVDEWMLAVTRGEWAGRATGAAAPVSPAATPVATRG